MRFRSILIAAVATLGLAACHHNNTDSTMNNGGGGGSATAGKSLYDRLGGKDAISAVVEDFVGNVAADTRINSYFANADIPHLKQMLKDQICAASGGPCTYTGKDMKTAHTGMHIKDADFNALVEDLVKSLDKFKVDDKSKSDLLGALGGMKGDIVGQ